MFLSLRMSKSAILVVFLLSIANAQGQGAHDQVQDLFQSAKQALESGNFKTAVEEFRKIVRLDPSLYQAQVDLGLAYHAMGDLPHAVEALAAARKSSTELGGANFVLGSDYLELGKPALAIPPLEDAIRDGVKEPNLRSELCSAFVRAERFADATRCGAQLYGLEPPDADGWYQLGRQYLESARTLTFAMRRSFPADRWTKRLNADVAAQNANWKLAARFYAEAAAISPSRPGFHAAFGLALLHVSKLSEAAAEFDKEFAVAKRSVPGLAGAAEVALLQGDLPRARERFTAALEANPRYLLDKSSELASLLTPELASSILDGSFDSGDAGGRYIRALALLRSRKDHEATATLQTLTGAEPKIAQSASATLDCEADLDEQCIRALGSHAGGSEIAMLSAAYVRVRDFDKAAKTLEHSSEVAAADRAEGSYWLIQTYIGLSDHCFDQLLQRYPSSALAYRLRAEYDEIRDDPQAAIENYQRAAQLDSQDPTARAALATLLLGQNRVREASTEAEAALALEPNSPSILILAGKIDLASGNEIRAGTRAKKALSLDPGLLPAHELLGRILWKQEDAAGAAAQLEQALPLDQYGDLHYLLYRAYQKQGKTALAQQALAESKRLRRASLKFAQEQVAAGAPPADNQQQ
ncbi:MAG: tetratricopeptide repeat protein [Bryobacteraceae bacterium]